MNWKFGDMLELRDRSEYAARVMFVGGGEEASDIFTGFVVMDDDDETDWTGEVRKLVIDDWTLDGS